MATITMVSHLSCQLFKIYSPIAQSVERLTVNQNVRGSSPRRGASFRMRSAKTIIQLVIEK